MVPSGLISVIWRPIQCHKIKVAVNARFSYSSYFISLEFILVARCGRVGRFVDARQVHN